MEEKDTPITGEYVKYVNILLKVALFYLGYRVWKRYEEEKKQKQGGDDKC